MTRSFGVSGSGLGQGLLLARMGRDEEALAAFEAALALEPDLAVLQNDVAWALARLRRDLDRALALAARAAAASENDPSVLDTLAFVRLTRGDAAEALAVADRALRGGGPELRGHLQYVRAEALTALARPGEARVALAAALASAPAEDADWLAGARTLSQKLALAPTEPSSTRVE